MSFTRKPPVFHRSLCIICQQYSDEHLFTVTDRRRPALSKACSARGWDTMKGITAEYCIYASAGIPVHRRSGCRDAIHEVHMYRCCCDCGVASVSAAANSNCLSLSAWQWHSAQADALLPDVYLSLTYEPQENRVRGLWILKISSPLTIILSK